ncbi:MAG: aminoacyl-tRNA hydrolase [Gemmatimonadaceae bacterium]
MKVILGLGNPGAEYESTRHNVGWWTVDHLASAWRFDGWKKDRNALVARGRVGPANVRLIKPLTYMNLSGAVLTPYSRRPLWDAASDLLVIVDDAALPLGVLRLRARGSAGGHNGLKSIETAVGGRDYARLRIGIAPTDQRRTIRDLSDFVLSTFGHDERETVLALMPVCTDAAELWLRDGVDAAIAAVATSRAES